MPPQCSINSTQKADMKLAMTSLAVAAVVGAISPSSSSAASPSTCAVKSSNDRLVLMHCPAGLQEKDWIEAAKTACTPGKPCNVWIWEDASKIPPTAPKTDAELPKNATSAAVAVWVNDSSSLMKLRQVR